jgi:20S proteasome subunit alpha 3
MCVLHVLKVEYALESVNHAGTCVGIHTRDGVLLASEKKVLSKVGDST